MKEKNCRRGHGMEADPWHGFLKSCPLRTMSFTSGKMVCVVSAYLRMAVMDADGTHMLPLPVTWRQQKVVAIACYRMSVRPGVTRCDKMTSFDFKVSSSLAGEVSM